MYNNNNKRRKKMKKIMILLFVSLFSFSVNSNAKSITLGWAAWDPANALQELTKEFTSESGIEVIFEFVPWRIFADRMLNELNI